MQQTNDDAARAPSASGTAGLDGAVAAEEGLRLLMAFRSIVCPDARARVMAVVQAEAGRAGDRSFTSGSASA